MVGRQAAAELTNTSIRVINERLRMRCSLQTRHAYAYVPVATQRAFGDYARVCGMTSKSELLKLLIMRELRLQRLSGGAQNRQPATAGRSKITAHLSPDLDAALAAHTSALGVTTSHAAALLVERELSERWLETALTWEPA